ncbi:MAG: aminotransferase class III-fold pyridoxal phosphate-dependent enzyme [Oligoflexales bacterium]
MERLKALAALHSQSCASGLSEENLRPHLKDPDLLQAVEYAEKRLEPLRKDSFLQKSETEQIRVLQERLVNFYPPDNVNPYVALAACGPWVITTAGGVIYDTGGYGMLGFGHAPKVLQDVMSEPHVMANVMTASLEHRRFTNLLDAEIGRSRKEKPFEGYACLNSGSEGVTIALRMSDAHAAKRRKKDQKTVFVSLKGSFHGRTDRPAQVSDSCMAAYQKNLASFQDRKNLITVEPNDIEELKQVFTQFKKDGVLVEAMLMEPVMGEGNPGLSVTPEFYQEARRLTREAGAFLIVDSVQAGLRTTGCLSLLDYPGFENVEGPDCEVWSKAVNGGQYPLSVVGVKKQDYYAMGTYGNTMTGNPRALAVGCAVLEQVQEDFRQHVRHMGECFVSAFQDLKKDFPDVITEVQGTGLLFSIGIHPEAFDVLGPDGLEVWLRRHGLGVIHGGTNSLRFTPIFRVTKEQIKLVVDVVRQSFQSAERKKKS